jgi:hypothetical protein
MQHAMVAVSQHLARFEPSALLGAARKAPVTKRF